MAVKPNCTMWLVAGICGQVSSASSVPFLEHRTASSNTY
jgi:hypothetical protein